MISGVVKSKGILYPGVSCFRDTCLKTTKKQWYIMFTNAGQDYDCFVSEETFHKVKAGDRFECYAK